MACSFLPPPPFSRLFLTPSTSLLFYHIFSSSTRPNYGPFFIVTFFLPCPPSLLSLRIHIPTSPFLTVTAVLFSFLFAFDENSKIDIPGISLQSVDLTPVIVAE